MRPLHTLTITFLAAALFLGVTAGAHAQAQLASVRASVKAVHASARSSSLRDPSARATAAELASPARTGAPREDSFEDAYDDSYDDAYDDGYFDDDFDDEFGTAASLDSDRLEPMNRKVFRFNRGLDRFFFDPFTHAYQFVFPRIARKAVHNAFLNLDSPVVMINALLQGRSQDAGDTLGRFVLNSTVGLGGLIDVATMQGAPRPEADFGQTLASFGAPHGPYVVVPFLGPSTVRDGIGRGVDVVFQPLTYIAGPLPGMLVSAGRDLTYREQKFAGLKALEESSIDFYAALRSAYLQGRTPRAPIAPEANAGLPPVSAAPSGKECAQAGQLRVRRPGHTRDRAQCTGHEVAVVASEEVSEEGAAPLAGLARADGYLTE